MADNIWEIVHDGDNDNGIPSIWARKINNEFYFITLQPNGLFNCEKQSNNTEGYITLKAGCKSLTSAKRWIATYAK